MDQLNLEDHYDELVEAELQAMLREAVDRPIDHRLFLDPPAIPTTADTDTDGEAG